MREETDRRGERERERESESVRQREGERDHLGMTPESPLRCLSPASLQIAALSFGDRNRLQCRQVSLQNSRRSHFRQVESNKDEQRAGFICFYSENKAFRNIKKIVKVLQIKVINTSERDASDADNTPEELAPKLAVSLFPIFVIS